MHLLNTPRHRNTRAINNLICIEPLSQPNIKNTLNNSRYISYANYLHLAYKIHKYDTLITVRDYNTCGGNATNCGRFPYPNTPIPTKVNQFGTFLGGTKRMLKNF